ncbi:DUF2325 domain-containing protein [Acidovorax sp. NCPPB 2350]|nr:DUF2325 domain-containing protein [Acidovorax sp. NCPPB 2350]
MRPSFLDPVLDEHRALMAEYGRAQLRCSRDLAAQARQIEALQAQAIRLRARAIVAETALAWAREDHLLHEAEVPGLPRRRALARQVEGLTQRLHGLMREVLHWQWRAAARGAAGPSARPGAAEAGADLAGAVQEVPRAVVCIARGPRGGLVARPLGAAESLPAALAEGTPLPAGPDDSAAFEASLRAADFVICQTGCVGHDDYWRVQDHCRRTGKPCVLVDQPQVVHVIRGLTRHASLEVTP